MALDTYCASQSQLLNELEDLFATIPPTQLRRNMEELYHAYLAEPTAVLPSKDIAVSFYFLIRFLNEVELLEESNVSKVESKE